MPVYLTYYSDRMHPLVYMGVAPRESPTLTVENYIKWYSLHLVHLDGSVDVVNFPEWGPSGRGGFVDHVPDPVACQKLAADNGWVWDENSLDMIWGRWRREVELAPEYDPDTGKVS